MARLIQPATRKGSPKLNLMIEGNYFLQILSQRTFQGDDGRTVRIYDAKDMVKEEACSFAHRNAFGDLPFADKAWILVVSEGSVHGLNQKTGEEFDRPEVHAYILDDSDVAKLGKLGPARAASEIVRSAK